jgi:hypothetical protein
MNPANTDPSATLDTSTRRAAALAAAAVALALTWLFSWGFVDSTRVARWIEPAAASQTMPARVVL